MTYFVSNKESTDSVMDGTGSLVSFEDKIVPFTFVTQSNVNWVSRMFL